MGKNNDNRIEVFLDGKLGRWTRLLFWREELSSHLGELYDKELQENGDHEKAWGNALKDFGDVNDVSEKLWELHKPRRVVVRLLVLLFAVAILYWIVGEGISVFTNEKAVAFLAVPVMILVPFLLFSNRLKLKDINFYAKISACMGCLAGAAGAMVHISDPSCLGPLVALSLLCALYAIVFLNVGKWSLIFFFVIHVSLAVILSFAMSIGIPDIQLDFIFTRTALIKLAAISVSGVMVGWAIWGFERLPKFLPRIAVGIMTVNFIIMLMNMRYPEEYWGALLLGFLPIIIFPFVQKILLYYLASRRSVKIR